MAKDNKENNDFSLFWFYVVILVIAYFTLPSEEKQINKVKEELRVIARKEIKQGIRDEDFFTQLIGVGIMKDNDTLDKLINLKYSIEIDDYWVFSLIKVKDKETEESRTIGLALFGGIFIKK